MTIPKDKALHFSLSLILSLILTLILYLLDVEYERAYAAATLLTLAAGVSKELYDKFIVHSQFSTSDLLADMFGIIAALLILLLIALFL